MDWTQPFTASYRFMRVDRKTFLETEELRQFTQGGTITRNADTTTKESGQASIVGGLDIGPDLVRVYLDATGEGGGESVALGTFIPTVSSRDVDGSISESKVTLNGILKQVEDADFDAPVSIAAGGKPVSEAAAILRGCGLEVVADDSDYTLGETWTFGVEQDESDKLSAVNDLLDIAGFSSVTVDEYGTAQLRRYQDPSSRAVSHEFVEGASARFLSQMTDERDTSSVANVVKVIYSTSDATTIGIARDNDASSPYSIPSLGREVCKRYEYQDTATQEEADAKALSLLKTEQAVTRTVTMKHIFVPGLTIRDAVDVEFPTGGVSGKFAVRTQDIDLGAGCLVETEVRRSE